MRKTLYISAVALSFLVASPVLAATFSAGQTYTLDKQDTVNDDLYAAGGSPIISGTILGDAMLAGGTITFNGSAKNNLMAAGGTVTVLGTVGSSVRVAGGTITISAPIGADVVAAGGTITIADSSTVGRDVAVAGGNVQIAGAVGRDVTVRGAAVTINGTINGNVDIQASKSVTLGSDAVIKGDFTYSAPSEVTKDPSAVISGKTTYNQTKDTSSNPAGMLAAFVGLFFLIKFLAYGAAVVFATTVFARATTMVIESSMEDFWKNISLGFVTLIIVPVAFMVLLVSVLGAALGFLALFIYIILLMLAKVFTAILAGAFLSKWYKKEATVSWKWALLGLVAVDLIGFIPIIGWVGVAVLFLAAFGALASLTYYAIADSR